MWLETCLELFDDIAERHTGQRLDLAKIERELLPARARHQIGPSDVKIIEETSAWNYPQWWPKLSGQITDTLVIPASLGEAKSRKVAVQGLHHALRHIEVVSVFLRFLWPEEFGILSPPVASLLNLVPLQNKDEIDYYLRYISVLEELRGHYSVFERIADFDMALWSATHLFPEHRSIAEEMYKDDFFREVRLHNLLEGFGRSWGRTDRERLVLAKVLLGHDHVLAALIAGRCYESTVRKIAERLRIGPGNRKLRQGEFGALVDKVSRQREIVELPVTHDEMKIWQQSRDDAVHCTEPVPKGAAEDLILGVERLCKAL
jgi:hypothetical protein